MLKLNPIGQAAAGAIEVIELDAAREVALRLPIKEAMRTLSTKLAADLDAALKTAIERFLGEPLLDLEILRGRLTLHPDGIDTPKEDRGETYAMDGKAILWAGPVRVERDGDNMKASRGFKQFHADSENTA